MTNNTLENITKFKRCYGKNREKNKERSIQYYKHNQERLQK